VRAVATTSSPEFQPLRLTLETRTTNPEAQRFSLFNPRLDDLASLSEEDFRMMSRHSPIKRAKYHGWLRNLCVAMGNSGDARFIPWLERALAHPDPIVREHAEWALNRITRQS
jgi:epoxyqueuosine reductase